ncbi:MAG TPA: LuxR family transcriptional regulator, partial [Lautropia sp.]|nr:LuxR family transcriptional regulator [Lautropia sp.]
MVETWHVDAASRSHSVAASSIALLLDASTEAEPAARMLAFLNEVAPVDYFSLVEYVQDRHEGLAAPELLEGHAGASSPNVTAECFAHYRRHFWREDRATHIAQQLGRGADASPVTGLHFKAGDIHVPSWRTEIYERARLADRLTFLYSPVPHSAYSINLYRDLAHGAFRAAEIERLLAVAPLLKQTHRSALRAGSAPGEAL